MLTSEELRRLLDAPHETETVDFKRQFGFDTKHGKLELARDVVCLANRSGGFLVFGIGQTGTTLSVVGLPEGDEPPDPTEVNRLLAKHFRPQPIVTVAVFELDGRRFGVVQVPQFVSTPSVCYANGNDETGELVLRQGDLYRRNDAMECERACADSLAAVLDAAVTKRAATYRQMQPADSPGAADSLDVASRSWEPVPGPYSGPTLRALHAEPIPATTAVSVRSLIPLLEKATVFYRVASVAMPRSIDVRTLGPDQVTRDADHVSVQLEKSTGSALIRSTARIDRSLVLDIRESLWEDADYGEDARRVDVTALIGFVYAALAFVKRLYEAAEEAETRIGIGLMAAKGRVLTTSSRYTSFFQPYVVTSQNDVWIVRDVKIATLGIPQDFVATVRSIAEELVWYFGLELREATFEAQINEVRDSWFSTNVSEGIVTD